MAAQVAAERQSIQLDGDRSVVIGLAVAVAAFLMFAPAVAFDFVNWDDNSYIYDNPLVLGGLTWAGVRRACTDVVFGGWMPLTILSYQLDATICGASPWCYHLTNVVLHAISSGLLAVTLVRMTGQPGLSVVAALIFALHPLRVESVAWAAERKDVLSVVFLMVGLAAYELYCRRPTLAGWSWVFVAMLCSLLSKSTLVTMPLLLGLCDLWPLRRVELTGAENSIAPSKATTRYPQISWARAMLEKLPLLGLAVVFSRITLQTQSAFVISPLGMSFTRARLPNAIEAIGFYCRKSLVPVGLHPAIYHVGTDRDWWAVGLGAVAVVGLVAMAMLSVRRLHAVTWGIVWFGIALVPVLGLVQTGFHAYADRFTYVPHIGLAVAATWAGAALARRLGLPRHVMCGLAGIVIIGLAGLSVRQLATWRDGYSLWQNVLRLEPDHPIALGKLGNLAYIAGDYRTAERLYLVSIAGDATYGWVIASLARTYQRLGDEPRMRQYRDWAERIGTSDADVQKILAELPNSERRSKPTAPHGREVGDDVRRLLETGSAALAAQRFAAALVAFESAAAIDPDCGAAHNLSGIALVGLDRHREAADRFEQATRADPEAFGFWVNLARARADLLEWPACVLACGRALAIDGENAEVQALQTQALAKMKE